MPVRSAEYWLEKADLARKKAERMRGAEAKAGMLAIACHYEQLAEQTQRLQRAGIAKKV